ncbi:head-tail joining protein [Pseudotabrizicola algicola]|uniref:Uncharacterized protein n=1 Tax=Pseudotabrizicola algicola TaxID=2709381 RepID=A0A6B3RJW9_9RHOB|nr:hypothetical protein [Pseudotabrizicola algicola]NEX45188.1 hypothetical protein [Pseudotabrizicola algicola]
MTRVFDGMAGVLNSVFGAPVMYLPQVGLPRAIQSVFREAPITVSGPDGGDVLIVAPTWQVPRNLLNDVKRNDQIEVSGGRLFRVLNQIGTGSPAGDAFIVYELEALP